MAKYQLNRKVYLNKKMYKCTPREIIKAVPDIQTVILPTYWFDNLSDDRPVFTSLYEWMLENDRVPQDNKETLHNRTYVGEKLFRKLLGSEKKRLKKTLKIKGDELDRAVSWSDINSGPKTQIGGCNISGDAILIIPESSRQALGDFFAKIYKKVNEAEINKVRANAAGATFYQWLLSQINRPDRVGDVARDAAADDKFPKGKHQYEEIKSYLDSIGACSAAGESFKQGWLEYLQQYPERVKPCAWCSGCGKKLDVEEALIAWNLDSQELFILDAMCLSKYKRFEEFGSRLLSGLTHDDLRELIEKDEVSEFAVEELIESLKLWGVMPVTVAGLVYFIRSEITHEIKIGFTGGTVEKRLKSIKTSHPRRLQVLATMPGTLEDEKSLHERFAKFRLQGEWFKSHPDLLAFISVILKDQSGETIMSLKS